MKPKWPDWSLSPNWQRLWQGLGWFVIIALLFAFAAFVILEVVGWTELWPGISTLSDWLVDTYGPGQVAKTTTRIGLAIVGFGLGWILVWRWHAWQVWRDQEKRRTRILKAVRLEQGIPGSNISWWRCGVCDFHWIAKELIPCPSCEGKEA